MFQDNRIVVVLPAYNAEHTLEDTYNDIPLDIVDAIILVDDFSSDETVKLARKLNIHTICHKANMGYGANQKTCYSAALAANADIVIMLHPDYQYTPLLIRSMVALISEGLYDVVLGSRILGNGALKGGMPVYKYIANRILTLVENILIDQKLSEYHTGYRAFSRAVLTALPLESNSDDFVFDNEMLVQCHACGFRIAEITCPAKYFKGASSINFCCSMKYGFGCLGVGFRYFLHRLGLLHFSQFAPKPGGDPQKLPYDGNG